MVMSRLVYNSLTSIMDICPMLSSTPSWIWAFLLLLCHAHCGITSGRLLPMWSRWRYMFRSSRPLPSWNVPSEWSLSPGVLCSPTERTALDADWMGKIQSLQGSFGDHPQLISRSRSNPVLDTLQSEVCHFIYFLSSSISELVPLPLLKSIMCSRIAPTPAKGPGKTTLGREHNKLKD